MKIRIDNLPVEVTEEDLKKLLPTDSVEKIVFRKVAYVTLKNQAEEDLAISIQRVPEPRLSERKTESKTGHEGGGGDGGGHRDSGPEPESITGRQGGEKKDEGKK